MRSNKKLAKLLSILKEESINESNTNHMNMTYKIEQPRNTNKSAHKLHTASFMTVSDMPSDLIMVHDETNSLCLKRSLTKISVNNQSSVNMGDSIVSTAEEHLTRILNLKADMPKFKPKSEREV